MPYDHYYYVQFLGGPFDGHRQAIRLPPNSLAKLVVLPVSKAIFAMLNGVAPASHAVVTSEALYQLEDDGGEPRYRFLKSVAPVTSPP